MDELILKEKLEKTFREVFDDENICLTENMTAEDIEEWDSLMHIHLLLAIEKTFDISFSTSEVVSISNVGEFMKLLNNRI